MNTEIQSWDIMREFCDTQKPFGRVDRKNGDVSMAANAQGLLDSDFMRALRVTRKDVLALPPDTPITDIVNHIQAKMSMQLEGRDSITLVPVVNGQDH